MLIAMVRKEQPDWDAKQCAGWLSKHMKGIRAAIRRATRNAIIDEMMHDYVETGLEGWKD